MWLNPFFFGRFFKGHPILGVLYHLYRAFQFGRRLE